MFSQPHIRSAVLSTLAVLLVLLASVGAPGAGASQSTIAPVAQAAAAAPTPDPNQVECAAITAPTPPFSASNFPNPPKVDSTFYPLVPGTQFIMQGVSNLTGQVRDHLVIFTVTDLVKKIDNVYTVVLWDRDIHQGVLVEAELAFHALDNAGNAWVLGEYPEESPGGQFSGAPSTWFTGQANTQGGTLVPGNPQEGTPMFLQAYAPPDIIHDCGKVSTMGTQVCNPTCYDNVLVINEFSPHDPPGSIQQKYYAPGVGNFQIGAVNDPQGETLVLKQKVQLSVDERVAACNAALGLEEHAYQLNDPPDLYKFTAPMEKTGACATAPTATPPTETPTTTPVPTPLPGTKRSVYLPSISHIRAVPPAIYDGCKTDPNPAGATNFPVRIVSVDKVAETVTLENVSDKEVSVEDWNMCSLATNQDHDQIAGTLLKGQIRTFPNIGGRPVWNDGSRNDGALYDARGFLVSYWVDQ